MKTYTASVSHTIAENLKKKGMPKIEGKDYFREPSYAEVFDWLLETRGVYIFLEPGGTDGSFIAFTYKEGDMNSAYCSEDCEWSDAADEAIMESLKRFEF